MKPILVLGGAGLVGCNLSCLLIHNGYEVIAVDKNSQNLSVLKKACPNVTTKHIDLVSMPEKELVNLLQNHEVIVQLQAQIMSPRPSKFKRNNIDSVEKVVQASKKAKIKHLIHLSSSVVISVADDLYTKTKRKGEKIVAKSGVPYTALRPPLMYGCFDAKHLGWLTRLLEKSPVFPIPGSGRYMRQPLFVMDLCNVILKLVEDKPHNTIYNIIGKERIDFIDLIKIIAKEKKLKRLFVNIPIPLFLFLLKMYSLILGKAPFRKEQLEALTAGDDFPVTDWEKQFGVRYTAFRNGAKKAYASKCWDYSKQMVEPH